MRPALSRALWFVALWSLGVATLAVVGLAIRSVLF